MLRPCAGIALLKIPCFLILRPGAGIVGVEPTPFDSKSNMLPLHQTPINGAQCLFLRFLFAPLGLWRFRFCRLFCGRFCGVLCRNPFPCYKVINWKDCAAIHTGNDTVFRLDPFVFTTHYVTPFLSIKKAACAAFIAPVRLLGHPSHLTPL